MCTKKKNISYSAHNRAQSIKKLLAKKILENDMLKDVMSKKNGKARQQEECVLSSW